MYVKTDGLKIFTLLHSKFLFTYEQTYLQYFTWYVQNQLVHMALTGCNSSISNMLKLVNYDIVSQIKFFHAYPFVQGNIKTNFEVIFFFFFYIL